VLHEMSACACRDRTWDRTV